MLLAPSLCCSALILLCFSCFLKQGDSTAWLDCTLVDEPRIHIFSQITKYICPKYENVFVQIKKMYLSQIRKCIFPNCRMTRSRSWTAYWENGDDSEETKGFRKSPPPYVWFWEVLGLVKGNTLLGLKLGILCFLQWKISRKLDIFLHSPWLSLIQDTRNVKWDTDRGPFNICLVSDRSEY